MNMGVLSSQNIRLSEYVSNVEADDTCGKRSTSFKNMAKDQKAYRLQVTMRTPPKRNLLPEIGTLSVHSFNGCLIWQVFCFMFIVNLLKRERCRINLVPSFEKKTKL